MTKKPALVVFIILLLSVPIVYAPKGGNGGGNGKGKDKLPKPTPTSTWDPYLPIPPVLGGDMSGPYYTKEQKIDMWKTLWDNYDSGWKNYRSAGKSYEGRDIWLFEIGNTEGGVLLWDAELHGTEDNGGLVLFWIAQWLLESGDPLAQRILERNYVMFVPMVNIDVHDRPNANYEDYEGVDLNRNFNTGWKLETMDVIPPWNHYSGPFPASESETQAMISLFEGDIDFYTNLHVGGGPYANQYRDSNTPYDFKTTRSKIGQISNALRISRFSVGTMGSTGYAVGDAGELGASAWLIEILNAGEGAWRHEQNIIDALKSTYFLRTLAVFIAQAQLCEV